MSGRALVFIHVFLGCQLLAALDYYVTRVDKRDERFAWRMFSPERMERCDVRFRLGDSPRALNLTPKFHEAWSTIARRGRVTVIEAMARHLCDEHSEEGVSVQASCRGVDGKSDVLSRGVFDLCKTGAL